jgi:hypothetical protein
MGKPASGNPSLSAKEGPATKWSGFFVTRPSQARLSWGWERKRPRAKREGLSLKPPPLGTRVFAQFLPNLFRRLVKGKERKRPRAKGEGLSLDVSRYGSYPQRHILLLGEKERINATSMFRAVSFAA